MVWGQSSQSVWGQSSQSVGHSIPSVWGQHIIFDCAECDPESIRRIEHIEAFITELCEKTEMKKWGHLHALCLEDDEYNRAHDIVGYSVCQFIQTSSIVGHFCETSNSMYLDFFSCKKFNDKDVAELVNKYFNPKLFRFKTIDRQAPQRETMMHQALPC